MDWLIDASQRRGDWSTAVYAIARLKKARGNTEKACEWATKAKDGFQCLDMTEDYEEMRCLLDELE